MNINDEEMKRLSGPLHNWLTQSPVFQATTEFRVDEYGVLEVEYWINIPDAKFVKNLSETMTFEDWVESTEDLDDGALDDIAKEALRSLVQALQTEALIAAAAQDEEDS